ncbi:pitrilysin family protein [Rhodocytophaga aerolata]|uniref:Pitrilysin family protein n=1 Tax=Rhodocytophaga aerolata TaxID=455078 RepID=A0ABT8R0W3_9BACT|nr:pitrilysin family protein [Rhodocytophaga aerolata]MDO1445732.1 pitrilysin family protein [Rhodocytophaga aerolata]
MKKLNLTVWLCVCIFTWAQAQTKLVEKVTRKGNELLIPYEKYVLPNGLTVIVHEDHSDPVVHVDVTYHVGSAREEVGKSGFAHFFEHMMFQGSDHVADEEHFKIVSEAGGTLNGTTNRDRTNYFETLPSNQLETALWLEADRMGFLLDAVTQKKFEIQRATVKNERGQNYDNRPYGLVSEYTSKHLYPYGHPYSWLTIGYLEDLDRSNLDDLKNFFLRWYGPNNAVLTIGGDVNTKDVIKLVEKYFGPIAKGPEVKPTRLPAPVLAQDRYISYEDNIRFPMLRMVYPAVPNYHPDEAPLDLLAEILGQGKNSILYKNLTLTQKAVQANASNPASELAGEFTFTILPYPGQTLDSMEAIIRQSLLEFEKRGVTDDDLNRFKASYEAGTINSLSAVAGKVSQLAQYQTFTGDPNYMVKDMKRHMAITKEDVMRVYTKYLKGKKAVILSVLPKGQNLTAAAPDNHKISTDNYNAPEYGYEGLKYAKAKDNFDRSKRPAPGKNPVVDVPPFWTDTFENGIKVIGAKNNEIPTVTMLFTIEGGHNLSAFDPSKAGIASLTASLMNEDTETYTAEEMSNQLEKLGSSISISSGPENTVVVVQSLVKNLDATLKLLEERLYRPKFAQDDFERLKKQQLEGIANQNTQPTVIASKVYNKLLFGESSIRAVPMSGTETTVKSITLDDVKNFYKSYFSPTVTNLVIVGDMEQNQVMPKLAFLNKWEKKDVKLPELSPNKSIDKTKIYLVDKEKAPQSEIRMGYVAMPYDATEEYYKSGIMNYILGGAFNSRINLNLREDKGYTYGARSFFSGTKLAGPYTASAGVRGNATDSAVVEFVKEITNFRNSGITQEELAFTKNSIGQRDALNYETGYDKASFLSRIIQYNLDKDFVKKQNEILKNITKEEIDALAKKHLPIEKMNILVVGDKASVKPGLEKLGYEVVELDFEGNLITPQVAPAPAEPASEAPAGAASPATEKKKKKKS